jgi:hypothetical protein
MSNTPHAGLQWWPVRRRASIVLCCNLANRMHNSLQTAVYYAKLANFIWKPPNQIPLKTNVWHGACMKGDCNSWQWWEICKGISLSYSLGWMFGIMGKETSVFYSNRLTGLVLICNNLTTSALEFMDRMRILLSPQVISYSFAMINMKNSFPWHPFHF